MRLSVRLSIPPPVHSLPRPTHQTQLHHITLGHIDTPRLTCQFCSVVLCIAFTSFTSQFDSLHTKLISSVIIVFYCQLMNKGIALKEVIKFTLKQLATFDVNFSSNMFRCDRHHHHQGAYCVSLLNLQC